MRYLHLTLLLLPFLFAGCDDTGTLDEPQQLVVEGWIDSDGYPVVLVTTSVTTSSAGEDLKSNLVRWGKVTISDGERSVVLAGGMDKTYFPPYSYRTFAMKGEPGKTYSIFVEYDQLQARASCTMPQPIAIDTVLVSEVDTLYRDVRIRFRSPGDGFCKVYSRCLNRDKRELPAQMGNFRLAPKGEVMEIPVRRGKSAMDTVKFSPHMQRGDYLQIKLAHVQKEVYDFWNDYDDMILFSGSQWLSSPTSLPTNIEGGYGIWSAQGTTTKSITLH